MSESLSVVVINMFNVLGGNWDPTDNKFGFTQCTGCITGIMTMVCVHGTYHCRSQCQFDS